MKIDELKTKIIEGIELAMRKQKVSKNKKERMFYLGQRVVYQKVLCDVMDLEEKR